MKKSSFFASLVLLLVFCLPAASQTITGILEGKVTDKSGAVIPNATINAVNTETGLSRSSVTT